MGSLRRRARGAVKSMRRLLKKSWRGLLAQASRVVLALPAAAIRRRERIVPGKVAIMTHTSTYACNPKYIYEEMRRRDPGREVVWLLPKSADVGGFPKDSKVAFLGTLRGIREAYSAAVWIDNGVMFSTHFRRRPEQLHVQTMHGSLGIKRLDNGIVSRSRNWSGRRVIFRESTLTDYVVTNSAFEEEVFRSVFWKNTPMVRLGHARTDPLFGNGGRPVREIRDDLRRRYGVSPDLRIALFAPTFRRYLTPEDLKMDHARLVSALRGKFGGEWILLVRLHVKSRNMTIRLPQGVAVEVTDYPDMQELMMVADVGITDYSSWIFDYVVTGRPGFVFAPDFDRYTSVTSLCYPLEETPFPVAYSAEGLLGNIAAFDPSDYARRVKRFLDGKECVDDGRSAGRVVDWLETLPQYRRECANG